MGASVLRGELRNKGHAKLEKIPIPETIDGEERGSIVQNDTLSQDDPDQILRGQSTAPAATKQ